jgi:hypothetical protein
MRLSTLLGMMGAVCGSMALGQQSPEAAELEKSVRQLREPLLSARPWSPADPIQIAGSREQLHEYFFRCPVRGGRIDC